MKSKKLYHAKRYYEDSSFIEVKIWEVPRTEDKPHGLKYSFVYIVGGKRIVGYDNGEQKGDHRHAGKQERPYCYEGIDKLWHDFLKDVEVFKKGGVSS